jgi:hypothetical protein
MLVEIGLVEVVAWISHTTQSLLTYFPIWKTLAFHSSVSVSTVGEIILSWY